MLRGGVPEPLVHNGVLGESVESMVRSPDVVEEHSTILMLQDRFELFL